MEKYTLDTEVQRDLHELLEDTISYWCNEHMISGELAWLVTECLSKAKLEQFRGNIK